MEAGEAKRLAEEIKKLRRAGEETIRRFLQSKNILTASDKIKIFKAMPSDFLLDYNFMKQHLLELASDSDEFVDLLLTLSQKRTLTH